VYHLTFGAMQDALVRRDRPSDADVEHVVDSSITIASRPRLAPDRRSDMGQEHSR
jgi:hypothetical protein